MPDRVGRPLQPPVVYLHGFAHTAEQWRGVAQLTEFTCAQLFLSLPFHGAPGVDSFAAAAESLWRAIDAKIAAETRIVLAGYSLGARLGLTMALQRPDRTAGLFFASGHFGLDDQQERLARIAHDTAWAAQFREKPLVEALAEFRRQPVFGASHRRPVGLTASEPATLLLEKAYRQRLTLDPQQLAQSLVTLSLGAMPPLKGNLSSVEVPVTLFVGEQDHKFLRLASHMSAALPAAELVVAAEAGHDVLWDAPRVCAEALVRLVGRCSALSH